MMNKGLVYLVGAGPGDPQLITLAGVAALAKADIVLYDFLANPYFLSHTQKTCQSFYVGKPCGACSMPQDEITRLMIFYANQGKIVVRLKGGDPFVFGRGGEEAVELAKAHIPFEVIPGVSSFNGVLAYAGIPLTHRSYSSSFAVITGYEESQQQKTDWDAVSKIRTLVLLMATSRMKEIAQKLMHGGMEENTPVAVISRGSYGEQKTLTTTLKDVGQMLHHHPLPRPTTIVVGKIVELGSQLSWFEKKPLFGLSFMLTRSYEGNQKLSVRLRNEGAMVLECPTIQVKKIPLTPEGKKILKNLKEIAWIVFTSSNAVDLFLESLRSDDYDLRDIAHVKIGAIGEATCEKLKSYFLKCDLIANPSTSEGLALSLAKQGIAGKKILLPCAEKTRGIIKKICEENHCQLIELPIYRVEKIQLSHDQIKNMMKVPPHWVLFASSSAVENFYEMTKDFLSLEHSRIGCIGPITANTIKALGLKVALVASKPTVESFVQDLIGFIKK